MHYFIGQIAAVGTAVCWSICVPCFTLAGRRIGSVAVNIHRLVLAGIFLSITGWLTSGQALPLDASTEAWFWLGMSGLIGFFLCDLCLFRSFLLIGPRIALLIMSLAPAVAAIIDMVFRGEVLGFWSIIGMAVTLSGVALVIAERNNGPVKTAKTAPKEDPDADPNFIEVDTAASALTTAPPVESTSKEAKCKNSTYHNIDPHQRRVGLLLVLIATVSQAVGMVFADIGMRYDGRNKLTDSANPTAPDKRDLKSVVQKSEIVNRIDRSQAVKQTTAIDDKSTVYYKGIGPFAATQMRLIIGLIGFIIMISFTRRWRPVIHGLTNIPAMFWLTLGTISGPFLGVSLGLLSLQHIPTGPAMTLMSLTPLLMLPFTRYLLKDHITIRATAGAAIAVVGAAMLFML